MATESERNKCKVEFHFPLSTLHFPLYTLPRRRVRVAPQLVGVERRHQRKSGKRALPPLGSDLASEAPRRNGRAKKRTNRSPQNAVPAAIPTMFQSVAINVLNDIASGFLMAHSIPKTSIGYLSGVGGPQNQ